MDAQDAVWAGAAAFLAGAGAGLWRAVTWASRRAMLELLDAHLRPELRAIHARIDSHMAEEERALEAVRRELAELRRLIQP